MRFFTCFRMILLLLCTYSTAVLCETKVVLLGTGNPNAHPDRSGPATAVIVDGHSYIFDAGTGVVRRAAAAAEKHNINTLEPENLTHVFLTHLHSDHTLGLSDIILTPWVLGRAGPLKLFGPTGSAAMANRLLQAYTEDIDARLYGLESANHVAWKVDTKEWSDTQTTYSDDHITVEAFPVCHGLWENAYGYRIKTADKVIVISGDTSYCPIMIEKAAGADMLIHEAYSDVSYKRLSASWAKYHAAYHTSAIDLARIANTANPKLLITTHQLTWGGDPVDMIEDEIKRSYSGAVVTGRDLDIF